MAAAMTRHAAGRAVAFFGVWLVLSAADPGALVPGVLAALAAALASLRLLPPGPRRIRLGRLPSLLLRFLWQSARGGLDVAWRALSPRLPLAPGFVTCPLRLPPGGARNALATEMSLLPGTLAVGQEGDALRLHCLDIAQPVPAQLAEEEARLLAALEEEPRHG
jgi:multicomponent Na+:H+ antiporter subunit E